MSADFWAGYISGAVGICVGNPLDIVKVRSQMGQRIPIISYRALKPRSPTVLLKGMSLPLALVAALILFPGAGAATPILAYGALNSLLFVTYNRSLKIFDPSIADPMDLRHVNLYKIWIAGAIGGLSTWIVSAPSELIKCRTQLHQGTQASSLLIIQKIWSQCGLPGFFQGGVVTSLRDSVGYGFYFSSYELCRRLLASQRSTSDYGAADLEIMISGGIAGIVTWASIYPLDVVKTRYQAEVRTDKNAMQNRLVKGSSTVIARSIFKVEGVRGLYRGLTTCSVRAFFVNAIQWYTYDKIMVFLASRGPRKTPLCSAKANDPRYP